MRRPVCKYLHINPHRPQWFTREYWTPEEHRHEIRRYFDATIDGVTGERYSRQVLFAPIAAAGQQRIGRASVVLVGCGALGTVGAEMLARAGVGRLRLIDRDFVEPSNLQRQSLFTEADAREGRPKAQAAQQALAAINSETRLEGVVRDLTARNIESSCEGFDVIVDATDNFETRFLVNDFAFKTGVPWVYGGCVGSAGMACVFRPGSTGCLCCLLPDPPRRGSLETCDTSGIIAPAVHSVAAFQVTQVLKLLVGEEPAAELFQMDIWEGSWRLLGLSQSRNAECRCCVGREFRYLEGRRQDQVVRLCGRNAVQVFPQENCDVDFARIARRLEGCGQVRSNDSLLRIEVDGYQIALFRDGRSIIKGTDDPAQARSVYDRYIGR